MLPAQRGAMMVVVSTRSAAAAAALIAIAAASAVKNLNISSVEIRGRLRSYRVSTRGRMAGLADRCCCCCTFVMKTSF